MSPTSSGRGRLRAGACASIVSDGYCGIDGQYKRTLGGGGLWRRDVARTGNGDEEALSGERLPRPVSSMSYSAEERVIGGGDVPCNMSAEWSADGEWIYFVSQRSEIWRETAAGGSRERVFGGLSIGVGSFFGSFTLMPDDASLILQAGQVQRNIWLRAPSGLETQLTFNDDASGAVFSYDGSAVYFMATGSRRSASVWQYRVADQRRQQVCTGLTASQLAVSPDGQQLVLVTQPPDERRQLWVCSIDGVDPPRRLFEADVDQRDPQFSPEGSTLYFVAGEGQGGEIWRVGLDGSAARALSSNIPVVTLNSVSPDGEWLSVSHHETSPLETWLYPTREETEPRLLMRGWDLFWTPENQTFMFSNSRMISTTWVLENAEGGVLPPDLPDQPTGEWFQSVGARRMSVSPFTALSPSPVPFEMVESRRDALGNLYRIELNR